jgi:hypothetical protein
VLRTSKVAATGSGATVIVACGVAQRVDLPKHDLAADVDRRAADQERELID